MWYTNTIIIHYLGGDFHEANIADCDGNRFSCNFRSYCSASSLQEKDGHLYAAKK